MQNRTEQIDIIKNATEGKSYMGTELEFGVCDAANNFNPVRSVKFNDKDYQPSDALKAFLLSLKEDEISGGIAREVSKNMVEINHKPSENPRAVAAKERLTAIIANYFYEQLGKADGRKLCMVYGAPWRPPQIGIHDVPDDAPAFQRSYYAFQIGQNGDSLGATGVHFNISSPWVTGSDDDRSDKMIRDAGRFRLVGGAIASALTASSPLSYLSTGRNGDSYTSALTQFNSARIGQFWAGRTIMDSSGLYSGLDGFRTTMRSFAENGILYSGRDLWLPVRPQPDFKEDIKFDEFCSENGVDVTTQEGFEKASALLISLFNKEHDPYSPNEKLRSRMEKWRQELLEKLIMAPRHRVEIRTPESPYSFEDTTSYEYIKSVYAFLELLFMYISTEPEELSSLGYRELELNAAKHNEQRLNRGNLDTNIYYVPSMHLAPAREILIHLLDEIRPIAGVMGRTEDIQLIRDIAEGVAFTPAERVRREVAAKYDFILDKTYDGSHTLPDTEYQLELIDRSKASMTKEIAQIEADLPSFPDNDRPVIQRLISLAKNLTNKNGK